tara:strand:+ start:311 stop:604 length:294 start_codon:yes stop_codon:yes gene_type:complete
MSKQLEWNLIKIFAGTSFVLALGVIGVTHAFPNSRATSFLEEKGYTDISVSRTGGSPLSTGCGKGAPVIQFEATNSEGDFERGRICSTPFFAKFAKS